MALLRTLVFYVFFVGITGTLGMISLPLLLRRNLARRAAHLWVNMVLWLLHNVCGLRSEVRGDIPPCGSIVAARHESTLDTLLLWKILGGPVFILKRELLRIPFFGWFLWRTGQIAINRKEGKQAMAQIMTQAPAYIAAGRRIVIFPEGTRQRPGQNMPFKKGVATLATELQAMVVPMASNHGSYWPKYGFIIRKGTAVAEFLPEIPPPFAETGLFGLQQQVQQRSEALRP